MKYRPLWSLSWFVEEYEISRDTITVKTGLLNLYNDTEAILAIKDVNTSRSLGQRILGLITIYLVFENNKRLVLKNVPVADLFSFVERCKQIIAKRRRVDVM